MRHNLVIKVHKVRLLPQSRCFGGRFYNMRARKEEIRQLLITEREIIRKNYEVEVENNK